MWAAIQPGAKSGSLQDRRHHGRSRPLALGTGDVHGGKSIVRRPEALKKSLKGVGIKVLRVIGDWLRRFIINQLP